MIPALSKALTIAAIIFGGPQTHTFLYYSDSISFSTSQSNNSLVNYIALYAFFNYYCLFDTRNVNLNLSECSLISTICCNVIGWTSSIWLTANMRWNLKFLKGLSSKIGLCLNISVLSSTFLSAKFYLNNKPSRSENGYNPVPPATIITFPGMRLWSFKPSPRG